MTAQAFIHDHFLLESDEAQRLFHEYAKDQPIIDYHCHLPPDQIAANHRFANLTQAWLYGDHYKWRAMRSNGVNERLCTGEATDREKFDAWAATVPKCLRNPLYHWTHLELRRPFGIDDVLLSPATADCVWERANAQLASPEFSTQGILAQMKVEVVCTTDDPCDSLEHHLAHARSPGATRMLPTWRPDKAMALEDPRTWNAWVDRLGELTKAEISTWDQFLAALDQRHQFFHDVGCRLSDRGLERCYAAPFTAAQVAHIFQNARAGKAPDADELEQVKSALMLEFGRMDHARGWTMQLHLGAMRNNNARLFRALGPDTGFDSIGDYEQGRPLSRFLDALDTTDQLPRTILYNLNPRDNELMATMIGNFQDGSIPGKMQFGSGWWFLDQWDGMSKQIEALSNLGLLSRFVGMLTDSRSFLSYTRHEYFRRLLCNILGNDMRRGAVPRDFDLVGGMVSDISYRNAKQYFGF
ncbi:MAG: glucuronate isomerase [Planctomycetota bacterium]|nr:MAG: glucuronate isomerase [Planctomycetota bacterium]